MKAYFRFTRTIHSNPFVMSGEDMEQVDSALCKANIELDLGFGPQESVSKELVIRFLREKEVVSLEEAATLAGLSEENLKGYIVARHLHALAGVIEDMEIQNETK